MPKEIKRSPLFYVGDKYNKNDFVYIDPPYLITSSEYNKLWGTKSESDLLDIIDKFYKKKLLSK